MVLIAILKRMFYDFLCEKKIIHRFITILQGARLDHDIKETPLDCQKQLTWTTHLAALFAVLSHVVWSRRAFIV